MKVSWAVPIIASILIFGTLGISYDAFAQPSKKVIIMLEGDTTPVGQVQCNVIFLPSTVITFTTNNAGIAILDVPDGVNLLYRTNCTDGTNDYLRCETNLTSQVTIVKIPILIGSGCGA